MAHLEVVPTNVRFYREISSYIDEISELDMAVHAELRKTDIDLITHFESPTHLGISLLSSWEYQQARKTFKELHQISPKTFIEDISKFLGQASLGKYRAQVTLKKAEMRSLRKDRYELLATTDDRALITERQNIFQRLGELADSSSEYEAPNLPGLRICSSLEALPKSAVETLQERLPLTVHVSPLKSAVFRNRRPEQF